MNPLLCLLADYRARCARHDHPWDVEQERLVAVFEELAADGPDSLLRTHQPGHFTGSALITNAQADAVLLTLHAKLGKWLQLGGHADGDGDLRQVAWRECQEESGRAEFEFFGAPEVFDLDRHLIPAHGPEPEHFHYDVRFLFRADPSQRLTISEESTSLRWFPLQNAFGLTQEPSMHRQFRKLEVLWGKR